MTKTNQKIPEGWSVKRLGEIFFKSQTKNIEAKNIPVLTNSAVKGVIPQNEYFDREIISEENLCNYYYVECGDFIYNPRISKTAPAGPIKRNHFTKPGCVSPLYTVFKIASNVSEEFYENYFESNLWAYEAYKVANYGARSDRMNITDRDFFNIKLPFPPLAEQKKIAEILSCWDEGIEKLSALIEKKKIQKKALMQQLLTGKHRLKGFSTPWYEVKLGKLIKSKKISLEKGKNLTAEQLKKGDIPVIAGGKTVPYYHDSYTHDKPSITISASGAYAGYVWFHKEKIWASDCNVMQGSESADIVFWGYVLQNQQDKIYRLQTGGAQPHVYSSDIKSLIVPELDIAEQKAIADILSKADKEIELLNKKLEAFKLEKKALMQKLLTGQIRVKVN